MRQKQNPHFYETKIKPSFLIGHGGHQIDFITKTSDFKSFFYHLHFR